MLDSNFWKNYFEVYDVLNLLIPYRELLEAICQELKIKPGEKVLEAGCGTGNLALKIKERGAEVIGLDSCKEALDVYLKKDPAAKIVLADLTERLPFTDNYFDKIASSNTIYAIAPEKRSGLLAELFRVLGAGGKLVLVNPHKENKNFKIFLRGARKNFQKAGIAPTLKILFLLLPRIIKIFYFNSKINAEAKKGSYNFFGFEDQKNLLISSGFINVSEDKLVYAGQAILNTGEKPLR